MTRSPFHHPSWLPLALIALLAALTTWLSRIAQPLDAEPASLRSAEPDYEVERFQAIAYDVQGHPRYRLAAEAMRHHIDQVGTALIRPTFSYEHPHRPPLRAQAERGWISPDGERVELIDAVRVEQAAHADRPAILLDTEHLVLHPQARTLATDTPVRIERGNSHIVAQALRADANLGTLHLTGKVKSHYEIRR